MRADDGHVQSYVIRDSEDDGHLRFCSDLIEVDVGFCFAIHVEDVRSALIQVDVLDLNEVPKSVIWP